MGLFLIFVIMIYIDIKPEELELAKEKAAEMGRILNSIRRGEGNIVGLLGEIIFARHFGASLHSKYDYDTVLNSMKIDVKTKETTVVPRDEYLASVAAHNIKQKCDVYYFVRIRKDLKAGWLLGAKFKEDFFKEATFNKRGEVDPSSNFGWKFRTDCYNLEIGKLIEDLNLLTNVVL